MWSTSIGVNEPAGEGGDAIRADGTAAARSQPGVWEGDAITTVLLKGVGGGSGRGVERPPCAEGVVRAEEGGGTAVEPAAVEPATTGPAEVEPAAVDPATVREEP